MSVNQRLRTYDSNNILLSDIQYNQQPEYQFSKSSYGYYGLVMTSTNVYALNATVYSPPSYNTYGPWNSIIPLGFIENFAIDTLNNIWLATPKGLVGYNDMGVITNISERNNSDEIIASPNPAQNTITFKFVDGSPVNISITCTDVLGKLAARYTSTVMNNAATISLDGLTNGLYYYVITDGEKTIKGKIIVLK